jgi:hypothetical protein
VITISGQEKEEKEEACRQERRGSQEGSTYFGRCEGDSAAQTGAGGRRGENQEVGRRSQREGSVS